MDERQREPAAREASALAPAWLARALPLPPGSPAAIEEASAAIEAERRDASRWKRLRCRRVTPLRGLGEEGLFRLEVGTRVAFDWSWEGSRALRPLAPEALEGRAAPAAGEAAWSGAVLEVDEARGLLYVAVEPPGAPPTAGTFFVQPFDFLAHLERVYRGERFAPLREPLARLLRASRGGVHPPAADGDVARARLARALEDAVDEPTRAPLAALFGRAWSVLWGPPGTGKTRTVGELGAALLDEPSERLLVVSTTNKATDAAALAIARAARRRRSDAPLRGRLRRVGSGARWRTFHEVGLEEVLWGGESEARRALAELEERLALANEPQARAALRRRRERARRGLEDGSLAAFTDAAARVVVTTAYNALATLTRFELSEPLAEGHTPFTTVVIDEAGLISRAAAAALGLLAARRVLLVGDPQQLAPIARLARVLPRGQAAWLAASGLEHLAAAPVEARAAPAAEEAEALHVLEVQHRMHPEVRALISEYQYGGRLRDAPAVLARASEEPNGWGPLGDAPRALWLVLDEDGAPLPELRARRGPGGRSWIRPRSLELLGELLDAWPALTAGSGLFVAPFVAQAAAAATQLRRRGLASWTASTVHAQQGAEAEVVVFDTVHAAGGSWPLDEWQRLVNVALSRARARVVVLASRHELREPFLRPLAARLAPVALTRGRGGSRWRAVAGLRDDEGGALPPPPAPGERAQLGAQLALRRALRPVRTREQERLIELPLDGRPRVVRGVAGSGKTLVLAHWLARAAQGPGRLFCVYANAALRGLIAEAVEDAWRDAGQRAPFPWGRVELRHVRRLLEALLAEVGLDARAFGFDYDAAAAAYLERVGPEAVAPRCDALFVDEAQDMGAETLRLLTALVEPLPEAPRARQVLLFYDDAQNLYGRAAPRWSELGLDVRGRSTVLRDSHRSTRPIAELALNVLYRLRPPRDDPEHRELVRLRLIEPTAPPRPAPPPSAPWWRVRFCEVEGPLPTLRVYRSRGEELAAAAAQLERWVREERVPPGLVRVLYNGLRGPIERELAPLLARAGVPFELQTGDALTRGAERVIATTAHSFKGYDAEVLLVLGLDAFTARREGPLAKVLYVALTRARSVLALSATRPSPQSEGARVVAAVEQALDALYERPAVEAAASPLDERAELLALLGPGRGAWLDALLARHALIQEPLVSAAGELLAEPLFWLRRSAGALFAGAGEEVVACFLEPPGARVRERLDAEGVRVIAPGEPLDGGLEW